MIVTIKQGGWVMFRSQKYQITGLHASKYLGRAKVLARREENNEAAGEVATRINAEDMIFIEPAPEIGFKGQYWEVANVKGFGIWWEVPNPFEAKSSTNLVVTD